jgi:dUTP pyrophosphatase
LELLFADGSHNPLDVPELLFTREPDALDLPAPRYATAGSAGLDLCAAINADQPVTLNPGERRSISTGLRFAIPEGFEGQVRPRSGLAMRHGIGMVNAPGTIDADYRGVVSVLLINHGADPFVIKRGDRIAQLVITPVARAVVSEARELDCTQRGEGGFGSTGIAAEG